MSARCEFCGATPLPGLGFLLDLGDGQGPFPACRTCAALAGAPGADSDSDSDGEST